MAYSSRDANYVMNVHGRWESEAEDERWDTVQDAYLKHLAEKHSIPILALHTPLHAGAWRVGSEETLVRSARLAVRNVVLR